MTKEAQSLAANVIAEKIVQILRGSNLDLQILKKLTDSW